MNNNNINNNVNSTDYLRSLKDVHHQLCNSLNTLINAPITILNADNFRLYSLEIFRHMDNVENEMFNVYDPRFRNRNRNFDQYTPRDLPNRVREFQNNRNTNRLTNNMTRRTLFENILIEEPLPIQISQTQIETATRRICFRDVINPYYDICPISLERFGIDDIISQIIHCGHIFNTEPLNDWFNNNRDWCPVCRYNIRNYVPENQQINNTLHYSDNSADSLLNTSTSESDHSNENTNIDSDNNDNSE
jgi:hypothetical protein